LDFEVSDQMVDRFPSKARVLHQKLFDEWKEAALSTKTPAAIRKVLLAFRAVCETGKLSESDSGSKKGKKGKKGDDDEIQAPKGCGLVIAEGSVFVSVVRFCTSQLPAIFDELLSVDTSTRLVPKGFYY
jgi:hypothetical protein